MLILGIDPGTATTGWGLVNLENKKVSAVRFGLIETSKDLPPEVRLAKIYKEMQSFIDTLKPHVLAIERVFFATNAKTAIRVGQAQGVMLLAAAQADVPIVEYAPGTIKKLVTGDGRANKLAMQESVRKLLGPHIKSSVLIKKTHFDNAADALAVAMCHVFHKHQREELDFVI